MFFQKEIETMPRKQLEALQLERLKWVVDYCDRNVEAYHKKLSAAKVTSDKIKQLSDIKYIPFTTKADIRDTYPYGLFAAEKNRPYSRIQWNNGKTYCCGIYPKRY